MGTLSSTSSQKSKTAFRLKQHHLSQPFCRSRHDSSQRTHKTRSVQRIELQRQVFQAVSCLEQEVPTAQVHAAMEHLTYDQEDLNRSVRRWRGTTEQTGFLSACPGSREAHRPPTISGT